MPKVILSGYIQVPHHDRQSVKEALPTHIANTRAEKGCLRFEVTESAEEEGKFIVYEEFESDEAFQFHQKRTKASEWGERTKNISRHYRVQVVD